MNKRIGWIDIAKGYGMLAIILGHVFDYKYYSYWLYSFSVPLFFFLSGYVFNGSCPLEEFVKKKARSILLPYICYGLIVVTFEAVMKYVNEGIVYIRILALLYQRRYTNMWFLTTLFLLNIAFYLLVKCAKGNSYKIIVVSIILSFIGFVYYRVGGVALPWNADVCFPAILFFCFGYFSRKKLRVKFLNKIAVPLLLLSLGGAYINHELFGFSLAAYSNKWKVEPIVIITALAGIMLVIQISNLKDVIVVKYIGSHSMTFLCFHQSVFIVLGNTILKYIRIQNTGIMILLSYLFLIIMAIVQCYGLCLIKDKVSIYKKEKVDDRIWKK